MLDFHILHPTTLNRWSLHGLGLTRSLQQSLETGLCLGVDVAKVGAFDVVRGQEEA